MMKVEVEGRMELERYMGSWREEGHKSARQIYSIRCHDLKPLRENCVRDSFALAEVPCLNCYLQRQP
jgi:hypothetical protein